MRRRLLGAALVAAAALLGAIELLTLLDPAGAQMADDGSPFGTPPSTSSTLLWLPLSVVLGALGAWLAFRAKRRPGESPPRALVPIVIAAAAAALPACAHTLYAPNPLPPDWLLDRAIVEAGGVRALTAARALAWSGDAVVHAGGRDVRIAGEWAVQPPDTAVVATYDVTRGPASTRALVVAAPRGWMVSGDRFQPMPPAMLANERDEFYLYEVMRLVPLRAPGVTLTAVPPDSLGQAGFRAEQPGRPPVEVYVDSAGRLAHLRITVQDPSGGAPVRQDAWLGGVIEAGGVRWPRELRLTMNGAPYFDLTLRSFRVLPRVDDPRLSGPP